MVPIVSFKETTGHGRVSFSMGGHSLYYSENVFLQFWKDSLLNSGLIFLMSRFKSTRVSGNVIIRLGGRVMKKKIWKLLKTHLGGPVPWSP